MRILFVWVSVKNAEVNTLLPLGIGYLIANLPKTYTIKVWDGILNHLANSKISPVIKRFQPQVVAFSFWGFNLEEVSIAVSQIKKEFPNLTVIIGGPSVSGYKEKIFDLIETDYAFAGEAEITLSQFLKLLAQRKITEAKKKQIKGLIFKDDKGKIIANSLSWETLDKLHYCDYSAIKLNKYLKSGYHYSPSFHPKGSRIAPVITTRGCPFPCEYCSARLINGMVVRPRLVDSVISEIKYLHHQYGITGFNVVDDNFTYKMDYAKKICREIIKLKLKNISFNSPNGIKVEYLDRQLLDLMKKAGWHYIFISPESGSRKTLKSMHKIISLAEVRQKIKLIKAAGLKVFGYFMIGYPGETLKDIKKTIDFATRNDFDLANFAYFMPLPGTPIYEKLLARKEIRPVTITADYFKATYAPKGFSLKALKLIRLWLLIRFYTSSLKRFQAATQIYSPIRFLQFVGKIISK